MPRLWLSVRSPALPTGHRREHTRPGYRASCFAVPQPPQRRATPFTDGRFDAFASCLLERLRVRDGGVVGALSAMKSTMTCRLQEYLVHLSKLGEVFRTESPHNTSIRTTGPQTPRPSTCKASDLSGPSSHRATPVRTV